jgi:hypothetical protein
MTPEEIAAKEAADAAAAKAAEDAAKAAEDKTPTTHKVKIDGEEKEMTLEELKEAASKSAGADKRFRDAAQMKEDAKKGIELKAAFEKVNSGEFDATDVRKLAELTGQDPDAAVASYNAELKKNADDKNKTTEDPYLQGPKKVKLEDLPEEWQEVLKTAKESQIGDAEEKIQEMVASAVDKDEILGKIVIEAPEELRPGVKEVVTSMVHTDVRAKILASRYTKEKFGPEMIRNSVQKARAEVKKLGIPSKSSKEADRVSLLAGLGTIGNLPAEVYSDEEVKRVSSTDPDYEDNAVIRLGQRMRRDLQKQG